MSWERLADGSHCREIGKLFHVYVVPLEGEKWAIQIFGRLGQLEFETPDEAKRAANTMLEKIAREILG